VGIALGFVLLEPADEGLRVQDVKFAHHLRPTDAGYAVVLYLWLLVRRYTCVCRVAPWSWLCAGRQLKSSSLRPAYQPSLSHLCAGCLHRQAFNCSAGAATACCVICACRPVHTLARTKLTLPTVATLLPM
jgi:hypothetical protein